MPLDHFIPQVHLKKFYSPDLGQQLHVLRKSDLTYFPPNAQSICRIEDGSTNTFLQEERAIEEFLRTIEPKYNESVEKLRQGSIDQQCIYTISGYLAYVASCSPGGMRIHTGPLKNALESTAMLLDKRGDFPSPPASLGGANLTELLANGTVYFDIDAKYPQAIGISGILERTAMFGNFGWEVLRNPFENNSFFTSDYPVAIERTEDPRILNRIVPLAPDLAIRVIPDIELDLKRVDFGFSNFHSRPCDISRAELVYLNRLIVQCAEELVIYRDDLRWIRPFVEKYRYHRIETFNQRLPTPDGHLLISSQRIEVEKSND
jgi:hypothetical protein